MQIWKIYAIISMIFAGLTSVLAKYGLQNISADFGLGIRTTVIFVIITTINLIGAKYKEFANLTTLQVTLLIASGNNHIELDFLLQGDERRVGFVCGCYR